MSTNSINLEKATALDEAYTDFILSKEAILVSKGTIKFYNGTTLRFIHWLKQGGIESPEFINSRHIRNYLAELTKNNYTDSYLHCFARGIKTFVRFLYFNDYMPKLLTFDMPPIRKKLLPVLSAEQCNIVIDACETRRDRALLLFMIDTGLRRAEICSLNWCHVDIKSGLVVLEKGKGSKPRSVVIGVNTRRALLNYKRDIKKFSDDKPLFQTPKGKRLLPNGLRSVILRLSKKTGIYFTPHALRRTFALLSLKAGMNIVYIQSLMGHSTLEMTRKYIQDISDEDLIESHNKYSPIDKFLK